MAASFIAASNFLSEKSLEKVGFDRKRTVHKHEAVGNRVGINQQETFSRAKRLGYPRSPTI